MHKELKMKSYPSIPSKIINGKSVYAFDKIDGSNIRAEWNKKSGFYKFGSRKQLISTEQEGLSEAKEIIISKYEKDLSDIFRKNKWDRAIVFFEFYGSNSFAGIHIDEPHDCKLFDVSVYKKGFIQPKEYLSIFKNIDKAELLYHGFCDNEFIQSVKNSTLEGMTFEGVVCKFADGKNTSMFKIKSIKWLDKVKNKYQDKYLEFV